MFPCVNSLRRYNESMVLAYDNVVYTNPCADILVGSNAYLSKLKPWFYVSFEHMLSKLEIVSIPWIKIVPW